MQTTKSHINVTLVGPPSIGKTTLCTTLVKQLRQQQQMASAAPMGNWFVNFIVDQMEESNYFTTSECHRYHYETTMKRVTLIDTPGAISRLPEILMGLAQADLVLLIIPPSALQLLQGYLLLLLGKGIRHVLIKLTVKEITASLQSTIQSMIPSTFSSAHVISETSSINNYLDQFAIERPSSSSLRLPIVHIHRNISDYLFGVLEQGSITKGQPLTILPGGLTCVVQKIYDTEDVEVDMARAGDNSKLLVTGLDQVTVGQVIATEAYVCTEVKAEIQMDGLVCAGCEFFVHVHTCHVKAEVLAVEGAQFLKSGVLGVVRLRFAEKVCLDKFENSQRMGSMLLLRDGCVIGTGRVLRLKPL